MDNDQIFDYEFEHKDYEQIIGALEAVGESVLITSADYVIQYVNNVFLIISGYTREEVIGQKPSILRSGQQNDQFYQEFWSTINGGEIWTGTFINKKKDGSLYFMRQRVAPIKDKESGKIIRYVSVGRDVTEKKKRWDNLENQSRSLSDANANAGILMAELEEKNAELEKVYKEIKQAQSKLLQSEKLASIGTLAAGVAHEINNPIGFISGNFQVLEQYSASFKKYFESLAKLKAAIDAKDMDQVVLCSAQAEQIKEDVNIEFMLGDLDNLIKESQSGAERIKKIVGDLRTFARADNEAMELTNVEDVITSVINLVWNEIKYKVELEKDFKGVAMVNCNPQRIGQVFINLIINASHAISEKGKIFIRTFEKDKHIVIEVEDTGKGIPKENLIDIFDAFFTTKPVGQGTGLGLSISHDIIEQHQGTITVESEVGKGAKFTIMLPIAKQ